MLLLTLLDLLIYKLFFKVSLPPPFPLLFFCTVTKSVEVSFEISLTSFHMFLSKRRKSPSGATYIKAPEELGYKNGTWALNPSNFRTPIRASASCLQLPVSLLVDEDFQFSHLVFAFFWSLDLSEFLKYICWNRSWKGYSEMRCLGFSAVPS